VSIFKSRYLEGANYHFHSYGPTIRGEKLPTQSNPASIVAPHPRILGRRKGDLPRSQPYQSTSQNSPEKAAQVVLPGDDPSDSSVSSAPGQSMRWQSSLPLPNGQMLSDQRQRVIDGGSTVSTESEHGSMLPPDYQQVFGIV